MAKPARYAFLALATSALASPAFADTSCADGVCHTQLTSGQLLQQADQLVAERRFDEAKPLLAALAASGQMGMESGFLNGYVAAETGDLDEAIRQFRKVLVNHPEQTRVRLELARAMMLKGQDGGADHNFRLAQQDPNLPPNILATIQASRGILRDRRTWSFSYDVGIAPDSNITNGTDAETVDLNFGSRTIPLTLDAQARAHSGIGQMAGFSGSYRLGLKGRTALLIEADSHFSNYKGVAADDFSTQIAAGPEFHLSERSTMTVQALGSQRLYGGKLATRQFGLRTSFQHNLDNGQRIGLSLDARRSHSGISSNYDGWQLGAYATYERVIGHNFVASANLYARRDALRAGAYSNFELGGTLGIGGELPHGINAGISGGIGRAAFDSPLTIFSALPRKDWRLNARAYLGLRAFRFMGFSPSISYSYSTNLSSLTLYDSKRSRFTFNLAHYF
jgi:outer membrane protein